MKLIRRFFAFLSAAIEDVVAQDLAAAADAAEASELARLRHALERQIAADEKARRRG